VNLSRGHFWQIFKAEQKRGAKAVEANHAHHKREIAHVRQSTIHLEGEYNERELARIRLYATTKKSYRALVRELGHIKRHHATNIVLELERKNPIRGRIYLGSGRPLPCRLVSEHEKFIHSFGLFFGKKIDGRRLSLENKKYKGGIVICHLEHKKVAGGTRIARWYSFLRRFNNLP